MKPRFRVLFVTVFAALISYFAAAQTNEILRWLFDLAVRITGGKPEDFRQRDDILIIAGIAMLGFLLGAGLASFLVRNWERLSGHWDKMGVGDKVTLVLGILAGSLCSSPIIFGVALIAPAEIMAIIGPVVLVSLSILAVYALRTMEDALPWYRIQGKPKRLGFKILDTNVIIDGRIYDVLRSGFFEGQLYLPKFVLEEIQYIADSADALRRQRGRRGLDVLKLIQGEFPLEVGTYDRLLAENKEEVDSRLVKLAKAMGADLVTNDVNLNRVAELQDVRVLNLNDLAMALKPNVLPRETLELIVAREGSQAGQGVGYLDDGTMVVIEGGRKKIGEQVLVVVTQVIQTERGKMIFADLDLEATGGPAEIEPPRKKPVRRGEP